MTNSTISPEEIAAKLTPEQREALSRAELDGNVNRYFSRFISVATGRAFIKAGLGTAVWSGVVLNDFGTAVRNHITGER